MDRAFVWITLGVVPPLLHIRLVVNTPLARKTPARFVEQ